MRFLIALLFIVLIACEDNKKNVSLYRTSVDGLETYYIASFDSKEGYRYNFENCNIAADLFENQSVVQTTKFFCK